MNTNIDLSDPHMLVLLGAFLAATWLVLHTLSLGWTFVWQWLDDGENRIKSPLNRFMMVRIYGYKEQEYYSSYGYRSEFFGSGDGEFISFISPALCLLFAPNVINLGFMFYPVVLVVGLSVVFAFLSRFVRRQSKLIGEPNENSIQVCP
jgi:hypothetical protein